MKIARIFGVSMVVLALTSLSGCGGSGSRFSQFEGSWAGAYQIVTGSSVESSGNMFIFIDQFGNVDGELQRTDSNQQTVPLQSAFITDEDELRFVFRYNDTSDRQVRGFIVRSGNFLQDESGLNISFAGGGSGRFEMNLSRQSSF